jgi:hypothetical protein
VIVILVEPGVIPGALPITSIVVFPGWSAAVPVNTPLPTAAGCPWIWTVALVGSTVPRTVTLLAAITLPLVGEATTTATAPEPTVLVVVEVVEPQPATVRPSAAMIPTVQDLIAIGIVRPPPMRETVPEGWIG